MFPSLDSNNQVRIDISGTSGSSKDLQASMTHTGPKSERYHLI